MLGSLFNKVAGLKVCKCFKNRLHRCFLWILQNFSEHFSYTTPLVTASDSPNTVQWLGCLSFDFAPPRAFDFDWKLSQNVAQIIIIKTFFPFTLELVRCFQFQGMIWKTEHDGENPDFDFVPLLFTLLWLKNHLSCVLSVVAVSCFNYIGSCTWF